MMTSVLQVLADHGLVAPGQDEEGYERGADQVMDELKRQGLVDEGGNVPWGRCVVLPSQEPGLSLMLVTPCPVDEFDENLRRKPSPV